MRVIQLDILRSIAIILVLFRHLPGFVGLPVRFDWIEPYPILKLIQRGGWIGVDLFFVLSGFLVSGLLFREYKNRGRLDFLRFYIRRGFKIYPAFYVMLVATFFALAIWRSPVPFKSYIKEALFIQNYFYGIWNHTWSLAVEEHFYICLGILCFGLVKFRKHKPFEAIVCIFIFYAIFALFLRSYYILELGVSNVFILSWQSHLRMDSLLFGVFLSYFHHFHHGSFKTWVLKWRYWILFMSLFFISPPFILEFHKSLWLFACGLTTLYLGFGGIMIVCLYAINEDFLKQNKLMRFLAFIGQYSYSIYLWHMIVHHWVRHIMPLKDAAYPIKAGVFIGAAIVIGIVAAKIIEMPFLAIRDRWFKSRSAAIAGAS